MQKMAGERAGRGAGSLGLFCGVKAEFLGGSGPNGICGRLVSVSPPGHPAAPSLVPALRLSRQLWEKEVQGCGNDLG